MNNGLHLLYSPVNQAWFLMWYETVLHIGTKDDMQWEMDQLLGDVKEDCDCGAQA